MDEYDDFEYGDENEYDDFFDDERPIDGVGFADPNGNSALRAETPSNPRIHPCPTCGEPDQLTTIDVRRHYVCDNCADRAEGLRWPR